MDQLKGRYLWPSIKAGNKSANSSKIDQKKRSLKR